MKLVTITTCDVRNRCPRCGRFVPESAIGSRDYIDPGSYYGVRSDDWTDCPNCGRVPGFRTTTIAYRDVQVEAPDGFEWEDA